MSESELLNGFAVSLIWSAMLEAIMSLPPLLVVVWTTSLYSQRARLCAACGGEDDEVAEDMLAVVTDDVSKDEDVSVNVATPLIALSKLLRFSDEVCVVDVVELMAAALSMADNSALRFGATGVDVVDEFDNDELGELGREVGRVTEVIGPTVLFIGRLPLAEGLVAFGNALDDAVATATVCPE